MTALRPYQIRAVQLLRENWRRKPVLVIPTGGGKTVVMEDIIHGAQGKQNRTLTVAHTRQIVHQTARRFRASGLNVGVEMGNEHAGDAPVVVASIQTIASRGAPPFDILCVDEAHHAASETYETLIANAPIVIGLTATPCRLDGKPLRMFGVIVEPVTPRELRDQGFLCDPVMYSIPGIDESKLQKVAGEFTAQSASESVTKLHGLIVKHWLELAAGSKTVAFCCDVEHAHAVAQNFRDAGVRAESVSGEDGQERRDEVLDALERGSLDLVANCQLYGEGWDLPALDCAILARPTASFVVHRQQIGRVLRPHPGKTAPIILDHAGNLKRHGSPFDDVEWSLDGRPKPGLREYKQCPKCYAMFVGTTCPECGCGPETDRKPIVETNADLQLWKPEDRTARYTELVQTASRYEYKLGWARMRFKQAFGVWPIKQRDFDPRRIEQEHYACPDHTWKTDEHGTRCERCLARRGM